VKRGLLGDNLYFDEGRFYFVSYSSLILLVYTRKKYQSIGFLLDGSNPQAC